MDGLGAWLGMLVMTLLGLVGLYASANAHDGGFYVVGLLLAGFSVLMLFRLVVLLLPEDGGNI
jgi:hypothetical protein